MVVKPRKVFKFSDKKPGFSGITELYLNLGNGFKGYIPQILLGSLLNSLIYTIER